MPERNDVFRNREDEEKFNAAYATYFEKVVNFLKGSVPDGSVAEDRAHEIFISLLRKIRQGEVGWTGDTPGTGHSLTMSRAKVSTYLFQVAKFVAIDELRKTYRSVPSNRKWAWKNPDGSGPRLQQVPYDENVSDLEEGEPEGIIWEIMKQQFSSETDEFALTSLGQLVALLHASIPEEEASIFTDMIIFGMTPRDVVEDWYPDLKGQKGEEFKRRDQRIRRTFRNVVCDIEKEYPMIWQSLLEYPQIRERLEKIVGRQKK